jgi:carboxyvinyl-carboxyphosphonate phosphorylmutase
MRTIQELETAGVAGIMIEDTVLPRAFGEKRPGLISLEEGIGKMRAALRAREDRSLTIIGRTSAAAFSSPQDALARAKAYEKVGVDAMFFAGGVTRELIEAVHAELKIPIMLGGGGGDLDKAWLGGHGVRVALQGHQPFSAAVQAVHDTLKALRDGTKPSALTGVASAALMAKVTRSGEYKAWTDEYLN